MHVENEPTLNPWKHRVPDAVWEQTEAKTLILAENDLSQLPARIDELKNTQKAVHTTLGPMGDFKKVCADAWRGEV